MRRSAASVGVVLAFALGGCIDDIPSVDDPPAPADAAVAPDRNVRLPDGATPPPDATPPAPDGTPPAPDAAPPAPDAAPPDVEWACPDSQNETLYVEAALHTYGGRDAHVASNGRFFVFTIPTGTTVAVEERVGLRVVATSPIGSTRAAAPLDGDVFVLAVDEVLVAFVAEGDDEGAAGGFVEIDRYDMGAQIRVLQPADFGVVVTLAGDAVGPHAVRWDDGFTHVGNLGDDGPVRAVAVDGARVAWLSDGELIWTDVGWRCDAAGTCTVEPVARNAHRHGLSNPRGLDLRDPLVALSDSQQVLVLELTDAVGLEQHRWQREEIQGLAVDADRGVFVARRDAGVRYLSFTGGERELPSFGASTIRIEAGFLLSAGDIALIRRIAPGGAANGPNLLPLTGPLHGRINAFAADDRRVLMGGNIAAGLLDPNALDEVPWRLTPNISAGPRVIRMGARDAALVDPSDIREAAEMMVIGSDLEGRVIALRGELAPGEGHTVGVTDTVLWDFARRREPREDSHRTYASLRAWRLDSGEALGAYTDPALSDTRLQVYGRGDRVAMVTHGSGCHTRMHLTAPGSASDPQPRELIKEDCPHRPPPRLAFAGGRFLHSSGLGTGEISLFVEEGDAFTEIRPPLPLSYVDAQIPWMANGRAWVTSSGPIDGVYPMTRLTYHDDRIVQGATIDLPAAPLAIIDVAGKTVVATASQLLIIGLRCDAP